MKRTKIEILISLLFIVVGLAAVTTNLIINGSTSIARNPDDFLVYFSDVKVDGVQDLSLIRTEKNLVFYNELSTVGDTKTIEYDVTNASKNYDATVSISCTESNNYLNVTNSFDQKNNLTVRSTRTGTLTIELTNAVTEEKRYEISCSITSSAVERETQSNNNVSSPLVRTFNIGDELFIGSERFNIISTTSDTVTMLAQYNLGTDYRQSTTANYVSFSNTTGWEYTPGPKEIDIQQYDGNAKTYVNEYVSYLKSQTGDSTITGNLITLTELKGLGCTIDTNYYEEDEEEYHCYSSPYKSWLINDVQNWWTRSANPDFPQSVWMMYNHGLLTIRYYLNNYFGIRPVITMSKSYFQNDLISFTLEGKTYSVPNGTSWREFLESNTNDTVLEYDELDELIYDFSGNWGHAPMLVYNPNNIVIGDLYHAATAFQNGDLIEVHVYDLIIKDGNYIVEDVISGWSGGVE